MHDQQRQDALVAVIADLQSQKDFVTGKLELALNQVQRLENLLTAAQEIMTPKQREKLESTLRDRDRSIQES